MSSYCVILSPEAEAHLHSIYLYIAADASPEIARRYAEAIARKCSGLAIFPRRGAPREDLGPGIRTLAFRRRATIVCSVDPGEVNLDVDAGRAGFKREYRSFAANSSDKGKFCDTGS